MATSRYVFLAHPPKLKELNCLQTRLHQLYEKHSQLIPLFPAINCLVLVFNSPPDDQLVSPKHLRNNAVSVQGIVICSHHGAPRALTKVIFLGLLIFTGINGQDIFEMF